MPLSTAALTQLKKLAALRQSVAAEQAVKAQQLQDYNRAMRDVRYNEQIPLDEWLKRQTEPQQEFEEGGEVQAAFGVYPRQRATPSSSETKQGMTDAVEALSKFIIPQDVLDVGLYAVPFGGKVAKLGIGATLAGTGGDAQAGVLLPALQRLKEVVPEVLSKLKRGATREDIYDEYGTIPITKRSADLFDYMPSPTESIKLRDLPETARAVPLSDVLDFPQLYTARPDVKDMTVILGPRGGSPLLNIERGRYSNAVPGGILPRSGAPETTAGLEAIWLHEPPTQVSNLHSRWGIPNTYNILEHELNHALQARGRASGSSLYEAGKEVPWRNRLHEITASLGAQNIPPEKLIRHLDTVLPLKGIDPHTLQTMRPAAIGGERSRHAARSFFNRLAPEEVEQAYKFMLKRAKGGLTRIKECACHAR